MGGVLATPPYPARRLRRGGGCSLRTPFQRDRDRIVHSKAFRRLKHKTQVFVAPEGDHYRTRLTHTLEATQISRTVARALGLNEDLVGGDRARARRRAPAVRAHRRGRAGRAAGASASAAASATTSTRCGWSTCSSGLNLTEPVRDGILRHSSGAGEPATLEGKIVRLVDRIAYINHDIDDALRAGVLGGRATCRPRRSPCSGDTGSRRIDTLVHDLVEHSAAAGDIVQGDVVGPAMLRLRTFMFERVYLGPAARAEHAKIERVLRGLFDVVLRAPGRAAAGRRRLGRPRDRLPRRDDRPLRDPGVGRSGSCRGASRPDGRATRRSRARRSATRSTSPSSSGAQDRAQARRARTGCRGCARSTRSGRRRSGSTRWRSSTTASAAARAATSSRS